MLHSIFSEEDITRLRMKFPITTLFVVELTFSKAPAIYASSPSKAICEGRIFLKTYPVDSILSEFIPTKRDGSLNLISNTSGI